MAIKLVLTVISIPVVIALILLITTVIDNRNAHDPNQTKQTPSLDFVPNASEFLRLNGFNFFSTLLHFSPDIFNSSPQTTIFAIPDSLISNLSIPPYVTMQLIEYHVLPAKLTVQDLFNKPLNACIATKLHDKRVSITKQDTKTRLLEINNVLVTRPDMFVRDRVVIHGVNGTFASFKAGFEINELHVCDSNYSEGEQVTFDLLKYKKGEWKMMVRFLGLTGYNPFVFGLANVLDEIVEDHPDLCSMTIFAPPVIEVLQMPKPLLHKFIKAHIVPKKYSYKHLESIAKRMSIKTLCPGKDIEIGETLVGFSDQLLLINRVEMTSPDLLSSKSFVVHGIARAFVIDGVTSRVSV